MQLARDRQVGDEIVGDRDAAVSRVDRRRRKPDLFALLQHGEIGRTRRDAKPGLGELLGVRSEQLALREQPESSNPESENTGRQQAALAEPAAHAACLLYTSDAAD